MKFSTLFAATVLATAGFGGAAYAQQSAVSPTNQDVPGSTSQENNAEALQRQGVAEQSGSMAMDAPSTTPGCQIPVGSQDSGIQECEEADRAAVAAGTAAAGQTVGPDGSTDPATTSSVQELPTDASPTAQDVPGSTSQENNAEALEREQVAQ